MRQSFYKVLLLSCIALVSIYIELPLEENRLTFCDVGQGDAILIQGKSSLQILVDTGPDNKVLTCLEEKMPFWDKTIELVVLTHPDLDHIGGFLAVTDFYTIDAVLYLPRKPDTTVSRRVLEEIGTLRAQGTRLLLPTQNKIILASDEITLRVINPYLPFSLVEWCSVGITETHLWDKTGCFLPHNTWDIMSKNSLSIGLNVYFDGVTIFLAGDMEEKEELALVKNQALHRVDVLKVGHHGAKTGTTRDILEVLQPEISVLSVGKNNKYNHPSPRVLQQLEDSGSQVFRTDTEGTVEFLLKEGVFLSK